MPLETARSAAIGDVGHLSAELCRPRVNSKLLAAVSSLASARIALSAALH
jgi:hypothetical protein